MTTHSFSLARVQPFLVGGFLLLLLAQMQAAAAAPTLSDIQQQWDITNFSLTGDAQVAAFEELQAESEAYTTANPDQAEGWIWRGIIDSSFAGAKGGLGALSLAKSARKHFDKAIAIDDTAMKGSAYTSLGTLYYSVPGWPIGFGDDEKAAELLLKGLQLDPTGIDSNYFYAEFLAEQKQADRALEHYRKALNAPAREGRVIADEGRRKQAQSAIAAIGS
jgi:tetratricopeptide (TPR) repeat protein